MLLRVKCVFLARAGKVRRHGKNSQCYIMCRVLYTAGRYLIPYNTLFIYLSSISVTSSTVLYTQVYFLHNLLFTSHLHVRAI